METKKKPKVVHMVTIANSVGLMRGQLSYLNKSGFDVTVIASPGEKLEKAKVEEDVNIKGINMERTISPFKDIISLIKIIIYFLKIKPDICNSGTPKAGLLGMLAAWFTRVPIKVYTIRGLPFEGFKGLKRRILILTEKIACACADKVICISPSIERIAIEYKLTTSDKTIVFGEGSSNGLQLERFEKSEKVEYEIEKIKKKYDLNKYNFIIGYVGRINNFKGIKELVLAFENLQQKYKGIALLMVGQREKKDAISNDISQRMLNNPNIIEVGRVDNPVPYYYIMDVLAFPTYREGFGNVSIEAQATGTPVVTTNATGAVDTVVNNQTGFIINVGEVQTLEKAIEKFLEHPELIDQMGKAGRKRVEEKFDSKIIWNGIESLYKEQLDRIPK